MSFTVSNTKCSNLIQFGGKEKGIQVHFQAGSCGVFSIRSSFRKGLFSRPDSNGPHRIFIFQWHYEQKGRNLSKKKTKNTHDHVTQICSWLISVLLAWFRLFNWEKTTQFIEESTNCEGNVSSFLEMKAKENMGKRNHKLGFSKLYTTFRQHTDSIQVMKLIFQCIYFYFTAISVPSENLRSFKIISSRLVSPYPQIRNNFIKFKIHLSIADHMGNKIIECSENPKSWCKQLP